MPVLSNQRHEAFARGIATKGLSASESYVKAGYSKAGADVSASRLLKKASIRARVDELTAKVTDKVVQATIAERNERIRIHEEINRRLWSIVEERGRDPKMANVPGGKSGFVVLEVKTVGTGERQKIVPFYSSDTMLSREIRGNMQQAAQDVGQWTEKRELTGKDGGPLTVDLFDSWVEEAEAEAEARKASSA